MPSGKTGRNKVVLRKSNTHHRTKPELASSPTASASRSSSSFRGSWPRRASTPYLEEENGENYRHWRQLLLILFLTGTRHENSRHRDLSDALLSCDRRISVCHSIVIRHWHATLELSGIMIAKSVHFPKAMTILRNYTNCIRISGILIQLAAATAARGTNLGKSPVEFWACY